MFKTYQTVSREIEAVQLSKENSAAVANMFAGRNYPDGHVRIDTVEGELQIPVGAWLVSRSTPQHVELLVHMSAEDFEYEYEEAYVEDEAEPVGEVVDDEA